MRRATAAGGREEGAFALWFALLGIALLAGLGLVSDGGRALSTRALASDVAQECARAGARAVDVGVLRGSNSIALDVPAAESRARACVTDAGFPVTPGMVVVDGPAGRVTVSVTATVVPRLLRLAGVGNFPVTETASAIAERGLPREGT